MGSFDRSFERIENSMELDKMHQRAEEALGADAINPDDFPRYDKAAVAADKEYVREMKEKFAAEASPEEREAKQMADVLEAIVLQFGEQGYWFGGSEEEEVTTVKTADYDDIKGGTDILVEYSRKNGGVANLGLGIDVTYREDLASKVERIRQEVASGCLTTLRYFYSPRRKIRGEQKEVPRVIVGVSGAHARDLGRLWMDRQNRKLSEHPVQIIFLQEMELQLDKFLDLAERQQHAPAARALADALAIVRKALADKDDFIEEHRAEIEDYRSKDAVYAALTKYVQGIGVR
jgi:hypothetical protein